jgi:DNA-binding NarL/FixJ family response regulator
MDRDSSNAIRILLVDDHALVRESLRLLIDACPDMCVVGEAGNCAEALRQAGATQPNVIVLDLLLEQEDALEVLPNLLALPTQPKVLILTSLRDSEAHRAAIRLGASGIVLKQTCGDVFLKAIRCVHGGELWLDRCMTAAMVEELRCSNAAPKKPAATLSSREHQIAHLVAQGRSAQQIANQLFISEKTVRNHLTTIYEKLQVSGRLGLAHYARRHNWDT